MSANVKVVHRLHDKTDVFVVEKMEDRLLLKDEGISERAKVEAFVLLCAVAVNIMVVS